LNVDIISLCGLKEYDQFGFYSGKIFDVIQNIPRIIPYKYCKSKKIYYIAKGDGLIEFEYALPFIKTDYETIFKKHYSFIVKVQKIRNKYEHKIHGAKHIATDYGNYILFGFIFEMLKEETKETKDNNEKAENPIEICAGEMLSFIKDINALFSKIQNEVKQYVFKNNNSALYYDRILRVDFMEFNEIYESKLLTSIGKIMQPF